MYVLRVETSILSAVCPSWSSVTGVSVLGILKVSSC